MSPEPRRASRQSKIALAVAGAAGLAIALWLTLSPDKRVIAPDGPAPTNDPRAALKAEIPAELALSPDTPAPGTKALAPTLPNEAEGVAKAIADARAAGTLPIRPAPGHAPGAPRMAGELGDALVKKVTMPASPFELATLLGGVLRTRGAAVEYGVVPNTKHAATEILLRRYAVRVKTAGAPGPWLAADGGPVEGATPLSDLDYLGNVLAFRALGAIAKRDVDTAVKAATWAKKLLPEDMAVAMIVAESQSLNELPDEARRTYEAAAAKQADAMTWYRLGQVARAEARPFKADEYFKKAIALDASFAPPQVGLAELALERIDVTPKEEHAGLVAAAKAAIEAADKADPKAAGIRVVKSHFATLEDKPDEARALLEEEVKLHPEEAASFVMLANQYAAEQKDQEALKTLQAAHDHGHETPDIMEGLAVLYGMEGDLDNAKASYRRALELDPESKTYRLQLAQIERQGGNIQKAKELLNQHIAKFPTDPLGRLLLAQTELSDGHPEAAKVEVQKLLAKDPTNTDAQLLDYLIGAVMKNVDPAARANAVAVAGSRRRLAENLLQNGLIDEAEFLLKDALTAEAEDLVAPVLLAAIYTATQREAEAAKLQEEILAKVPEDKREEVRKSFADAIAQALKAKEGPGPLEP